MRYKIPEENLKTLRRMNDSRKVFIDGEKALSQEMMRHVLVEVVDKKLGIKNFSSTVTEFEMNVEEGWVEIGLGVAKTKIIVPSDFNGKIKSK